MGRPSTSSSTCWWVKSDPCGLLCAWLTVFLLGYAWTVIVLYVVVPWHGLSSAHAWFYSLVTLLALVSHTRAQYSDPGAVARHHMPQFDERAVPIATPIVETTGRGNSPDQSTAELRQPLAAPMAEQVELPKVCKRCKTVKPRGVHHCSTCGRCIYRLDHQYVAKADVMRHLLILNRSCPWVNTCVGAFNQKYFLLFLLYTVICCLYSAYLLVYMFFACSKDINCNFDPTTVLLFVFCFIEAIIFGTFIIVMYVASFCFE
jgi:palmitoyltransferase ZDHHC3/7/25